MKILYLECNMGAAGDMLMSAFIELHQDPEDFVDRFNQLGIPKVELKKEKSVKCGITGTHMKVLVDGIEEKSQDVHQHNHVHCHDKVHIHEHGNSGEHTHKHSQENCNGHGHSHSHTGLNDIEHLINHLNIDEQVKKDAIGVYTLIAEAESHAHGKAISDIHFHEVGTMDAVADVVATCMLIHELSFDRILASPVNVGSGQVKCAHGILPVPAPATAFILQNVPIYNNEIKGELCTPTGAALLKYFVDSFEKMPVMKVGSIGYGMGNKDYPTANCVRVMLGTTENPMGDIIELCCNLDDITSENIGYAAELMMKEGALDVYTTPVVMKKNRPGFILTCMCKQEDKEKFLNLIFKHTTTLGVREYTCKRYGLERNIKAVETSYGTVRVKKSKGYGVVKTKIEYEDLAEIAKKNEASLEEVRKRIQQEI
ncbi:MAG: nickel pincer cofactor biosynthesis protein LarC [Eubacterium sp.]|jgi:uncharacterized protein (TIGR00299 family) protein|nr:nickel pincer cofactor biosynthesis protein LarC [Eubacterium sp.]